MQELEGILYRAKRGTKGAWLRRWAAVPAVAAINGVLLGGVAVLGGEEVRSQRVGVRALVGRWSGAGEPGKRRRGAGGGAAVGRKGAAGWRWETSPTGGPHLSVAVRERGGGVGRRWLLGQKHLGRRGGFGFLSFFSSFFQIDFKSNFPTIFKSNLFHILTQIYPTILRLLENLLNNFSNIFKLKLSFF
jgi:hypothetical protein